MATVEECEQALWLLAARLDDVDPATRAKHVVQRTITCRVSDLDVVFIGELGEAGLSGIRLADEADPQGQVRLTMRSDDLLALVDGTLGVPAAWATGRLKIEASVLDLLRLRSVL